MQSRDPGIPDRFSIPKSRDYERPNIGISGLDNNVLTLLLRVKCMHTKQLSGSETGQGIMNPGPSTQSQTEQLKGRSPVCINMFTLVNDLSAAHFVTISVDGTMTSNDTCVVISPPVVSNSFHNF